VTTTEHGADAYAAERDTTEGRVYTVTGGDWDELVASVDPVSEERLIVNLGPQHPSTHGVLRLVCELEGETVRSVRPIVGYLHTGIEKNMEYRTWVQGTTFVTRADYLAPIFNETAYCLAVEKLLDVEVPRRANVIRVIMMELNRISSHLVALATTGMELGALSMMIYGFRDREKILDIFEAVCGLRMNMAYVRPGGVAQDLPADGVRMIREFVEYMPKGLDDYEGLLTGNAIWQERTQGVGYLDGPPARPVHHDGRLLRRAAEQPRRGPGGVQGPGRR
jgi:NADH-quinone oxidoreductase subunit D